MAHYWAMSHRLKTSELVSMQNEGSLGSPSLKKLFKASLRLDAFVCYVLVVKRMKLKTNFSVFNLLGFCLWFHGFPQRHDCE